MKLRRLARITVDAPGTLLRHFRLRRLVHQLRSGRVDPTDERWLGELRLAWGNPSAADVGFLKALSETAGSGSHSILECGSGLTTLLLCLLAEDGAFMHVALEDSPRWAAVTQSRLARLKLNPDIRIAPLRDYGEFDWYEASVLSGSSFDAVVCDGPRAAVARGGRAGVLYVAAAHLAPRITLFLDDSNRPTEQAALEKWGKDFTLQSCDEFTEPSGKAYTRLTIDRARP